MARSFGEALTTGVPVVFTGRGIPEVICEPGKELQALELLNTLGIVKLMRPHDGKQSEGTLAVYEEAPVVQPTDTAVLKIAADRRAGLTPARSTKDE